MVRGRRDRGLSAQAEARGQAALPEEAESGPFRRCVASGETRPKEELVRFVIAPSGELVADVEGRLPGRGIWLSARRDVVHTALARGLFAKAARRPVRVPEDLADRVEALLARRCIDLIGLARRGGQAVAGFERVREALAKGRGGLRIEAADGSEAGRAGPGGAESGAAAARCLRSDELAKAFGRERTVHALIAPGALADKLRTELGRLAGFRMQ